MTLRMDEIEHRRQFKIDSGAVILIRAGLRITSPRAAERSTMVPGENPIYWGLLTSPELTRVHCGNTVDDPRGIHE